MAMGEDIKAMSKALNNYIDDCMYVPSYSVSTILIPSNISGVPAIRHQQEHAAANQQVHSTSASSP
jgi:hypothetical protein